jgi:hypothetical protein
MRFLKVFLLALFFVGSAVAQSNSNYLRTVFLEWDNSPTSTVTGYKIYWGDVTNVGTNQVFTSTNIVDAGLGDSNVLALLVSRGYVIAATSTVSSVSNLVVLQSYWFYVTAYDGSGLESDPSNTIVYRVPIRGPRKLVYVPR